MRAVTFILIALLMHIRSATATDGRTFTHVGRGTYHVVQRASSLHPFFRPGFEEWPAHAKLDQPYRRSTWVRAAIDFIAGPIASVPLRFATDARGGKALLTDDALTEFWTMPARAPVAPVLLRSALSVERGRLPLAEVIEATVGWLKLRGEAFWIFDDTWLLRTSAARSPFIIARPDSMREVVANGELLAWEYRDCSGRGTLLGPEQVLHLKCWNPYGDTRGLAPYEAAHTAAEADYLAGEYGRNLMRNNGDRGPIISTKGGMLTDQQQEQILRMLREKRAAAARGDFRPAFLSTEVSVEDPKAQALDAALVAQRIENRDEIAVAMGVPPSMFHVAASYSIGSASDYFRLIETGCMPVAAKLADAVEAVSGVLTGGKPVFAWFDFSQHSTMQQIRSERIEKEARNLWAFGMPFARINDALSLGLPRFEGDETGYLPFSVAPASEIADGSSEPDLTLPEGGGKPDAEEPMDKLVRLLEGRTLDVAAQVVQLGARVPHAQKASKWRQRFRAQHAAERRTLRKITKVLFAARKTVLGKIAMAKQAGARAPIARAAAADFVFNLATFTDAMLAEMRKAARASLTEAGQEIFDDLGLDDPWQTPEPGALSYLALRENRIRDASEEIHQAITASLTAGIDAGETMDELAARVKAAFKGIEGARAQTIAATETSTAFGVGRQYAMEQSGAEWKEWVTSGLPNVRATHDDANGQVVRVEDTFRVGSADLHHPGDPTGPAEEVINCRCVAVVTKEPPEEPEA